MNIEHALELEESVKSYPECLDEYCRLLEGMKIIQRYNKKVEYASEHDILYYGVFMEEMTEEDLTRLFELGWGISEEFDNSFYHFT